MSQATDRRTTVQTFTATIYVGLKNRDTGKVYPLHKARTWLQKYVSCGLCVTITKTEYIYTSGREPGLIVGLINYPRFPSTPKEIAAHAVAIAEGLKTLLRQKKVSIVFPANTVMIGEDA